MSGDTLRCPYEGCGARISELWDYQWQGMEDEEKRDECPGCGKPVVISRRISVDYNIREGEL